MSRHSFTPGYLAVLLGEGAAYLLLAVRGIATAAGTVVLLALVAVAALAVAFGLGLATVVVAMGGVRLEPVVARWWPFPIAAPGQALRRHPTEDPVT